MRKLVVSQEKSLLSKGKGLQKESLPSY